MQAGPYTKSNKHQTPANGTRLCQNLSASVQVVERARDPGASRVSRLGWSYPDTIGARRSALSVWILPALRQLRPLVQSMTVEAARTAAAAAFFSCWLDYCNLLLYIRDAGHSSLLRKLENATARLVTWHARDAVI